MLCTGCTGRNLFDVRATHKPVLFVRACVSHYIIRNFLYTKVSRKWNHVKVNKDGTRVYNNKTSIFQSFLPDYFVVVQTKEAGKLVLTAVPCRWIRDGFLFWPGKNANRLRMDLNSEPGSGWSKIACSVKRKYIPSYEEAEIEAAELSGQNTESSDSAPRRKKQKKVKKDGFIKRFDFNHLVPGGLCFYFILFHCFTFGNLLFRKPHFKHANEPK